MPPWLLILIIVLGVIVIALAVLYFVSKKAEKKQEGINDEMRKQAVPMSLFVIDKQKMRLKDAGLPKVVYENSTTLARLGKVPIVKVKAANQVMSLMCDPQVFKTILPKQEIKAQVAGLYIMSAKRIRGPQAEASNKKKKESIIDRLR